MMILDDETIHCHNRLNRQRIQLPEKRLRAFRYIGMTYNDIRVLPSEELLLSKLPDLQVIDVESNRNFDCSTLPGYTKIQILSDCGKEVNNEYVTYVPDIEPPNEQCDHECQLKKHYDALHAYVLKVWDMLKEKFEQVSKTQVVTDVRTWFDELISNIRGKNESVNDEVSTKIYLKSSEE